MHICMEMSLNARPSCPQTSLMWTVERSLSIPLWSLANPRHHMCPLDPNKGLPSARMKGLRLVPVLGTCEAWQLSLPLPRTPQFACLFTSSLNLWRARNYRACTTAGTRGPPTPLKHPKNTCAPNLPVHPCNPTRIRLKAIEQEKATCFMIWRLWNIFSASEMLTQIQSLFAWSKLAPRRSSQGWFGNESHFLRSTV